jgi:hypothetical protein
MKTISLLQPWAALVVIGAKQFETRSWSTPYRGPLLIHASQKLPTNFQKFKFKHDEFFRDYITDMEQLNYGAIIGKVELVNVYHTEGFTHSLIRHDKKLSAKETAFGDYSAGRYAWELKDPVQFLNPIPYKGALSLWEFPEDLLPKF